MENYNEWLRKNRDLPATNKENIRLLEIAMKSAVEDLNVNISNTTQLEKDFGKGMRGMYKFIVTVIIAVIGLPIGTMYYNTNRVERSNLSVITQIKRSDSLYANRASDYEIRLRVMEAINKKAN